jgi:hypothetical protein
MKIEVDINDEMLDQAILESLKEAYRMNCKIDKIDCSDEEIPVDEEFLNAVDLVISYYTNAEQYRAWVNEKTNLTK